jgi:hypothetical protein
MSESRFPAGWDAERVKRLIDYYEGLSEDEQVAEDEAGRPSAKVRLSSLRPRSCCRTTAKSSNDGRSEENSTADDAD